MQLQAGARYLLPSGSVVETKVESTRQGAWFVGYVRNAAPLQRIGPSIVDSPGSEVDFMLRSDWLERYALPAA